ncbi:hypothetical protein [Enhygromyxa salina]|uniref:hypothetical protein n=1 Tax=Enhygromyxa salina TaxID=215803 RepID=UPI000697B79C|nr:hypothetical protein [Enhygromyxa salina]
MPTAWILTAALSLAPPTQTDKACEIGVSSSQRTGWRSPRPTAGCPRWVIIGEDLDIDLHPDGYGLWRRHPCEHVLLCPRAGFIEQLVVQAAGVWVG